jgi:uncharacterized protein (DUF2147 family)
MTKFIRLVSGLLFLGMSVAYAAPATAPIDTLGNKLLESPVGYWQTIDDVTGQSKSIVQITDAANNHIAGKVVKLFDNVKTTTCSACSGANKNQPILGMTIMTNLKKAENNEWQGGSILDPKNGKSYTCKIQLVDEGHRLVVRGYIGLPIFGRSQTWVRVISPEVPQERYAST